MRRINVVGTSASGKTDFARRLAAQLRVPHHELDALHWEAGWNEVSAGVMRQRVDAVTSGPAWVIDGNYSVSRDIVWSRADTVVWLDFPLPVVLARWLRRTARRVASREELWGGNREGVERLIGRDSLLWWILRTYRRRRREYPLLLAARPDLRAVRLRSPRQAELWLASLGEKQTPSR